MHKFLLVRSEQKNKTKEFLYLSPVMTILVHSNKVVSVQKMFLVRRNKVISAN